MNRRNFLGLSIATTALTVMARGAESRASAARADKGFRVEQLWADHGMEIVGGNVCHFFLDGLHGHIRGTPSGFFGWRRRSIAQRGLRKSTLVVDW